MLYFNLKKKFKVNIWLYYNITESGVNPGHYQGAVKLSHLQKATDRELGRRRTGVEAESEYAL